jgi:hypothetical protein
VRIECARKRRYNNLDSTAGTESHWLYMVVRINGSQTDRITIDDHSDNRLPITMRTSLATAIRNAMP